MTKNKRIKCNFENKHFIDENSAEYKNKCKFNNREDKEPLSKFYDNHLFRYSLTYKIKEDGESITVILMNPSYADEYGLDRTLCNVRDFIENYTKFSKFEVLNVFPIRTPNSNQVLTLMNNYSDIQKENDRHIRNVLSKSNYVLVAWGGKYHNKAKWILDLLKNKNVYAYGINKNKSPRHFAPQAYNNVDVKQLINYPL